jgi:hypothetical protein
MSPNEEDILFLGPIYSVLISVLISASYGHHLLFSRKNVMNRTYFRTFYCLIVRFSLPKPPMARTLSKNGLPQIPFCSINP